MSAENPLTPEDFGTTVENFGQTTEIKHQEQSNNQEQWERKEDNEKEQAIDEAFELAKVQLQLASTLDEARQITERYYKQLKKYEDWETAFEEKREPDVFFLDDKPYSIIRATGGSNRLRLTLLRDFSIGDSVNVQRSNGEMDWDWRVSEITDDKKVVVEKRLNDRSLRKTINLKNLHSWNNER